MSVAPVSSRPSGRRAVVALNGVIALAVIALVAAVALVVRPPAPPGIAEFAPQASKPITKAPPGQSSRFGQGTGACAVGQVCAHVAPGAKPVAAAPAAAPAGVPSALQCFTWPDGSVTQTFDPQSPPCIATWPGQKQGNGGSTSTGVTATTVKVAFPKYGGTQQGGSTIAKLQPIVDFFNSRFELYGRHIQLVPFTSKQAGEMTEATNYDDPTAQRADAVQAVSMHPFAALDFFDATPFTLALPTYIDTLAKQHVVSISGGEVPIAGGDDELHAYAPYEWSYLPTSTGLFANAAAMVCRGFVGRNATHAATYAGVARKFAVVLPEPAETGGTLPGQDQFLRTIGGCGISKPPIVYYTVFTDDSNQLSQSMVNLKAQGVTSLLFYPDWQQANPWAPQKIASSIGYEPEWITMAWQPLVVANLLAGAVDEVANTFGIANWSKLPTLGELMWYQSYLAAGGAPATAQSLIDANAFYHELLLLAAGMQMAGPHLTPQSFAAALASTSFPNPGAGVAPSYQGRVGFPGRTMMGDFAEFWMDSSTTYGTVLQDQRSGGADFWQPFCYVGRGTRWSTPNWPTSDKFQQGSCR